jgi:protein associated with RNAse G/E
MGEMITVKALDAQGHLKYSWMATLLDRTAEWTILYGQWERLLHYHVEDQMIPIPNRSLEFYSPNRPFVAAAILNRAGELQEYYARVTSPPQLDTPGQLRFVMLGLALQVKPDYDYEMFDHRPRPQEELSDSQERGLIALVEAIERREEPFARGFLRRYLQELKRLDNSDSNMIR